MVASYILEISEDLFEDSTYNGIYRDDGIDIREGQKSDKKICDWLESFQDRVNEKCGSDHLQFTAEIWKSGAPASMKSRSKSVKTNHEESFPYLDVEMYWRADELKFRVHLKPNHLLNYLNRGSAHTNACFNAIPFGVLHRPAILTSVTP